MRTSRVCICNSLSPALSPREREKVNGLTCLNLRFKRHRRRRTHLNVPADLQRIDDRGIHRDGVLVVLEREIAANALNHSARLIGSEGFRPHHELANVERIDSQHHRQLQVVGCERGLARCARGDGHRICRERLEVKQRGPHLVVAQRVAQPVDHDVCILGMNAHLLCTEVTTQIAGGFEHLHRVRA